MRHVGQLSAPLGVGRPCSSAPCTWWIQTGLTSISVWTGLIIRCLWEPFAHTLHDGRWQLSHLHWSRLCLVCIYGANGCSGKSCLHVLQRYFPLAFFLSFPGAALRAVPGHRLMPPMLRLRGATFGTNGFLGRMPFFQPKDIFLRVELVLRKTISASSVTDKLYSSRVNMPLLLGRSYADGIACHTAAPNTHFVRSASCNGRFAPFQVKTAHRTPRKPSPSCSKTTPTAGTLSPTAISCDLPPLVSVSSPNLFRRCYPTRIPSRDMAPAAAPV